MVKPEFKGQAAIVLGTGPSLAKQAAAIRRSGYKLFGINNTFNDFNLDVWIACDPLWHDQFSPVAGDFHKWHWQQDICTKHGYRYIPGRWGDGLSVDPEYIHYGHSSGYQALNLAVLYGCDPIYLAGYDMNYKGPQRHYFAGLSDQAGEYPKQLRKQSTFDGLIKCYETIARQRGLPVIFNLTHDSALRCFPFADL